MFDRITIHASMSAKDPAGPGHAGATGERLFIGGCTAVFLMLAGTAAWMVTAALI